MEYHTKNVTEGTGLKKNAEKEKKKNFGQPHFVRMFLRVPKVTLEQRGSFFFKTSWKFHQS